MKMRTLSQFGVMSSKKVTEKLYHVAFIKHGYE
jgi:hypothetical protein